MRKNAFSANMKTVFLTYFFICISQLVGAPGINFHLKALKINAASEHVHLRYHQAEFTRFINDLGRSESGNNWMSVNCIGCFGEFQFAESTIQFLGYKYITLKRFRTDPGIFPRDLQRKALESLIKVNMNLLKDYEGYIGDTIRGVRITRAGMIAASHLGGAQSVRLYLASHGRINKDDVLGTSISDYFQKFSYYDL